MTTNEQPGQQEQPDNKVMPVVTPEQALESLNEFIRFWDRKRGDEGDAPDAHIARRFIEQNNEQDRGGQADKAPA